MTIPAAITFFRERWDTRFLDFAAISRATGSTFNETTGQTEPVWTEVYAGPALVRPASGGEEDFGEGRFQRVDYHLFLPADAPEVEDKDRVGVVSGWDPQLTEVEAVRQYEDSYLTRRRVDCRLLNNDETPVTVEFVSGTWVYRKQAPPPSSGDIRADGGTLYLHEVDADAVNRAAEMDAATVPSYLVVIAGSDAAVFAVTAAVDQGAYRELTGSFVLGDVDTPPQNTEVTVAWRVYAS